MTKNVFRLVTILLALGLLAASAAAQAAAQAPAKDKPVDMKKLVAEIVGDFEFAAEGQVMIVQFTSVDDRLFGAPPGETPEEIHPVEGKPLCFDITLADSGQYFELQFIRNDQGVIDKCLMNTMGMTVEGYRVKK